MADAGNVISDATFSSIAPDERGVIQIFNVGAERMLGYVAADVVNKITPALTSLLRHQLRTRDVENPVSAQAPREDHRIMRGAA